MQSMHAVLYSCDTVISQRRLYCIAAAPIREILPAIPSRQFINVVPRLAFIAIGDFAKVAPHKKANDQEGGAASRTQRRWRRTRQ
jgi:hypothetical protein